MVALRTRPNGAAADGSDGSGRGRRLRSRAGLPGSRAVVGGLLVTLSAVVLFAAARDAGGGDGRRYLVADRDLAAGRAIGPGDVRLVEADLPEGTADRSFGSVEDLAGAVAVAPIAEGELVQRGSVAPASGSGSEGEAVPELSFPVAPEAAVGGDLQAGDRIDVLATYGSGDRSRTVRVVRAATVLEVGDGGGDPLGEGGQLVVTVAVAYAGERLNLVNAVAEGTVTVLRTTGARQDDDEPTRSDAVADITGPDVADDPPGDAGGGNGEGQ